MEAAPAAAGAAAPAGATAAVAAAAAEPAGPQAGPIKEGSSAAATVAAAAIPSTFPVYVGHRRPLPPDASLFEEGNYEREQLARQTAVQVVRDERRQLSKEAELAADAQLGAHARFECSQCHATLPTARLLDIHVAELHDSYFAAQAARRMPVYLCLVEGCSRKFCTVEERKQHLTDLHRFPRNFHFDRIHLRRRKGQIRPLPQHRKGGHNKQAMPTDSPAAGASAAAASAAAAAAAPSGATPAAIDTAAGTGATAEAALAAAAAAAAEDQQQQQQGQQAQHADDVVHSMSRLSMAADASRVPNVISFGRGRGRGLAGVSRGRGGQKAHQHFMSE